MVRKKHPEFVKLPKRIIDRQILEYAYNNLYIYICKKCGYPIIRNPDLEYFMEKANFNTGSFDVCDNCGDTNPSLSYKEEAEIRKEKRYAELQEKADNAIEVLESTIEKEF
jgi:hypothetical protein